MTPLRAALLGVDRPDLDLNFAALRQLDPRVTFSRASAGSLAGPTGSVETAGINVPRFTHDPVTGQSLGLLMEQARTNLLVRSEELNDVLWTKAQATVTANVATAPNGISAADKLIEDTANSDHGALSPSASIVSGTVYSASVYLKAAERRYAFLALSYARFVSGNGVCFDLQTGTIVGAGTGSASAGNITPAGNGWFRCSISLTASVTGSAAAVPAIYLSNLATNSIPSYTGDGTSGIFVWGAQLEAGSFASSYIPTTGASALRAPELATVTGVNFSSWFKVDGITLVAEGLITQNTETKGLYAIGQSGSGAQRITSTHSGGTIISYFDPQNGVRGQFSAAAPAFFRVAVSIGAGQASIFSANGRAAEVTPAALSTVNLNLFDALGIGTTVPGTSSELFSGPIARIRCWRRRFAEAQIQRLSSI